MCVTGILYDVGSVYAGLSKLTDIRKAVRASSMQSRNDPADRGHGEVVW